jgi:hypothetical protein
MSINSHSDCCLPRNKADITQHLVYSGFVNIADVNSKLCIKLTITTERICLPHSTEMQTIHDHMEQDSHTLWSVQVDDMNGSAHLDKSFPSDLHSEPGESLALNHIYLHTTRNMQN